MDINRKRRRKSISPVLATVLLISITLIASTAIAGFVFGLFGTFTSTAQVSAGTVACSGTPEVCVVPLQNTGSGNAAITGVCNLAFAGGPYVGTAVMTTGNLRAGNNGVVRCTAPGSSHAVAGTEVTGSISLGNGAYVLFAGTAA